MRFIDLHCDTIWAMWRSRGQDAETKCGAGDNMPKQCGGDAVSLQKNSLCVDIEKMKRAGSMAQFFACFIYMDEIHGEDRWMKGYQQALEMIAFGKQTFSGDSSDIFAADSNDISLTLRFHELMQHHAEGKISAFLTIEEGGILDNQMERLERLYEEGIRLMTLTWNHENCLAYPNSRDPHLMQLGLKPFGIEVVERMNELGMVIDVSHMSDGGFWDVLKYSKKPVVVSHSNARSLCNHPRNLSDEMIKALAEKGGVAGVNFYPYFVRENGKISAEDIADHIVHMYQVGGEDFVAIGTDFDGFDEGESDIKDIGQMRYVYDIVKQRGFTESQMEKIWYRNALRLLEAVL